MSLPRHWRYCDDASSRQLLGFRDAQFPLAVESAPANDDGGRVFVEYESPHLVKERCAPREEIDSE